MAANGWANVTGVRFPNGRIDKGSGKNWIEYGSSGAQFNFIEVGQSNSSVFLRDNSRGINLELNLDEEKVLYSDDNGANFPLYNITGIQSGAVDQGQGQVGQSASRKIVEYSCNEGIPLLLQFDQIGDKFWVTWTHDSFKGKRLPQVLSGSGNNFSDGRYSVHTKGNLAYVNLDGIEDSCTEIDANAAAPTSAEPQDHRLKWQYSQHNDANNKGRTTSYLYFGIPETDAVKIFGSCSVGSSGNFSAVTFGADVRNMSEGQEVSISFSTGNFQRQLKGKVSGTQAEEGVSGVEIIIDNNDPLWGAMRRDNQLQYIVQGRNAMTAPLRGSSKAIKKFLADCKFYAGSANNNNQPKKPTKDDPRWASCNVPQNQKSRNLNIPVTVTFINKSEGHRGVFWMDFNGKPVSYAALNAGEEYTINTFLGHPWMFTDGPGNCIEMFQPQLGVKRFEISAPSPIFGD